MKITRWRGGRFAWVVTLCVASLLGTVLDARPTAAAKAVLVEGGRVLAKDGSLGANPGVLVADGKIAAVGGVDVERHRAAKLPTVRLAEQSVLSPGLIDLFSVVGAYGNNIETVRAIDPETRIVEVIDPTHRDLRSALEHGITTAMVCGAGANLIDGQGAVFRTHPKRHDDGALSLDAWEAASPLLIALGGSALRPDREPSSRTGAVSLLRSELVRAKKDKKSRDAVARFLRGETKGIAYAQTALDVQALLALLSEVGMATRPPVVTSTEVPYCLDELVAWGAPVVVGPYSFDSDTSELEGAAALAAAGVDVTFAGGVPVFSAKSPRITAALAVRHGVPANVARAGLTSQAARVAGIADRVGAIEVKAAADLVVFSDDPLRLDASVLRVWVGGVEVHRSDRSKREEIQQ